MKNTRDKKCFGMGAAIWIALNLLCAGAAFGDTAAPDVSKRLDDLDKAVKSAQMSGDNSWMLTSAALVLFYGGLVRRKNVLGTMMHSFVMMATVSILWAVVGYSLAFGEGSAFM